MTRVYYCTQCREQLVTTIELAEPVTHTCLDGLTEFDGLVELIATDENDVDEEATDAF